MMNKVLAGFTALGLAACASASGGVGSASNGRAGSWNGSFKPTGTVMSSSAITIPTGATQAPYGSIQVTPLPDMPTPTAKFDVSLFAPGSGGAQIAWAVFQGPCGAAMPIVAGQNSFPLFDVNNNGSARWRGTIAMTLMPQLSYHANVYWGSQVTDVTNVMMCANLSLSR
jgi:hypothetical protein